MHSSSQRERETARISNGNLKIQTRFYENGLTLNALFWTMKDMSQNAFSLIVCLPGEAPARHDLTDTAASLGRSPENSIQMLVAEVSVKHGSIVPTENSFRLIDGGSTNGTKVNGAAIGEEGVELKPMDKILFGTVIPAYFVPTAILNSTPIEELIASLGSAAAAPAARPKTAPVAIAQAVPLTAGSPAAGAATVKLDQVRTPGPGPVAPAKLPAPGAPPRAPGAPPAAAPPRAPGAPPAAAPGPPQPGKLPIAPPAGGAAPAPVPLKRPTPGAPPSIPLPKLPPKPGQ
jgi:hypothetical protein